MNRIITFLKNNYSSTLSTFKNCSLDSFNNLHLCSSINTTFNFDDICKILFKKDLPKSVDCIYLDDLAKKIYFIEFKNTRSLSKDKLKEELTIKIYSSTKVLFDNLLTHHGIFCNNLNFELEYIIVSNDSLNNTAYVQSQLGRYKNNYCLGFLSSPDIYGKPIVVNKVRILSPISFDKFVDKKNSLNNL